MYSWFTYRCNNYTLSYFQMTQYKATLIIVKAVRHDTGKNTLTLKNKSGVVHLRINVTVIGM